MISTLAAAATIKSEPFMTHVSSSVRPEYFHRDSSQAAFFHIPLGRTGVSHPSLGPLAKQHSRVSHLLTFQLPTDGAELAAPYQMRDGKMAKRR